MALMLSGSNESAGTGGNRKVKINVGAHLKSSWPHTCRKIKQIQTSEIIIQPFYLMDCLFHPAMYLYRRTQAESIRNRQKVQLHEV